MVFKVSDPVPLQVLPSDHVLMFFPLLLLLLFECFPALRSDYLQRPLLILHAIFQLFGPLKLLLVVLTENALSILIVFFPAQRELKIPVNEPDLIFSFFSALRPFLGFELLYLSHKLPALVLISHQ